MTDSAVSESPNDINAQYKLLFLTPFTGDGFVVKNIVEYDPDEDGFQIQFEKKDPQTTS